MFIGQNGKSVPNGITLKQEVVRQIDPNQFLRTKNIARVIGYAVMILSISMFSIAYCIGADTYPIWSMINMLTIILYFPLQNVQLSGEASIFIKEFLKVWRLEDLKIGRLFFYYGITDEFDRVFLADRGHNIYFEQFGYTSRYIIFNCTLNITIIVS